MSKRPVSNIVRVDKIYGKPNVLTDVRYFYQVTHPQLKFIESLIQNWNKRSYSVTIDGKFHEPSYVVSILRKLVRTNMYDETDQLILNTLRDQILLDQETNK